MNEEKILIASFCAEGGGFDLYIYPNGKYEESGSSGGFLDEDEDPIRYWSIEYESLNEWWANFTKTNHHFWVYFYAVDVHPAYKGAIQVLAQQSLQNMKGKEDVFFDLEEFVTKWQFP